MDTNHTDDFINNNSMEDHNHQQYHQTILHDQLPFDPLWTNHPPIPTRREGFFLDRDHSHHQPLANDHILEVVEEEPDEAAAAAEEEEEELGAMKELMYNMAAMQPVVDIDPSTVRKPKRRNVRISNDPQSVAARQRRERISDRIRVLQRLVPGGTKLDTAAMLDEAVRYVKFLKRQIRNLQLQYLSDNHHQQEHLNPPPPPPPPPPPVLYIGTAMTATMRMEQVFATTSNNNEWPPPPPPSLIIASTKDVNSTSTTTTTSSSSTHFTFGGLES